ncbi:hypothetical protein V6N13_142570 [Hibiscus sabdariffa]
MNWGKLQIWDIDIVALSVKVIFDGVTASVKVIFTVSLQANPSKVTGIDGMSAGFFQEHWFVVKDDVMKACSALFNPNQSTARVSFMSRLKDTTVVLFRS